MARGSSAASLRGKRAARWVAMRSLIGSAERAVDGSGRVKLPGQMGAVNLKYSRSRLTANKKMLDVMAKFKKYQSRRVAEEHAYAHVCRSRT